MSPGHCCRFHILWITLQLVLAWFDTYPTIAMARSFTPYVSEFKYTPGFHPSKNPNCPSRWSDDTEEDSVEHEEPSAWNRRRSSEGGPPDGQEPSIEIKAILVRCPKSREETDDVLLSGNTYNITAGKSRGILEFHGFNRDESAHHSEVQDCRRKFIVTMKLNNIGKTRTQEEFVVVDHVLDPVTMHKARLLNPYVFKVRQEQVLQLYGLKFESVVNGEAREEVINKKQSNYTGCFDDAENPTCGQMMFHGEPISFSQGFCCSCDPDVNIARQSNQDKLNKSFADSNCQKKIIDSHQNMGPRNVFANLFGNPKEPQSIIKSITEDNENGRLSTEDHEVIEKGINDVRQSQSIEKNDESNKFHHETPSSLSNKEERDLIYFRPLPNKLHLKKGVLQRSSVEERDDRSGIYLKSQAELFPRPSSYVSKSFKDKESVDSKRKGQFRSDLKYFDNILSSLKSHKKRRFTGRKSGEADIDGEIVKEFHKAGKQYFAPPNKERYASGDFIDPRNVNPTAELLELEREYEALRKRKRTSDEISKHFDWNAEKRAKYKDDEGSPFEEELSSSESDRMKSSLIPSEDYVEELISPKYERIPTTSSTSSVPIITERMGNKSLTTSAAIASEALFRAIKIFAIDPESRDNSNWSTSRNAPIEFASKKSTSQEPLILRQKFVEDELRLPTNKNKSLTSGVYDFTRSALRPEKAEEKSDGRTLELLDKYILTDGAADLNVQHNKALIQDQKAEKHQSTFANRGMESTKNFTRNAISGVIVPEREIIQSPKEEWKSSGSQKPFSHYEKAMQNFIRATEKIYFKETSDTANNQNEAVSFSHSVEEFKHHNRDSLPGSFKLRGSLKDQYAEWIRHGKSLRENSNERNFTGNDCQLVTPSSSSTKISRTLTARHTGETLIPTTKLILRAETVPITIILKSTEETAICTANNAEESESTTVHRMGKIRTTENHTKGTRIPTAMANCSEKIPNTILGGNKKKQHSFSNLFFFGRTRECKQDNRSAAGNRRIFSPTKKFSDTRGERNFPIIAKVLVFDGFKDANSTVDKASTSIGNENMKVDDSVSLPKQVPSFPSRQLHRLGTDEFGKNSRQELKNNIPFPEEETSEERSLVTENNGRVFTNVTRHRYRFSGEASRSSGHVNARNKNAIDTDLHKDNYNSILTSIGTLGYEETDSATLPPKEDTTLTIVSISRIRPESTEIFPLVDLQNLSDTSMHSNVIKENDLVVERSLLDLKRERLSEYNDDEGDVEKDRFIRNVQHQLQCMCNETNGTDSLTKNVVPPVYRLTKPPLEYNDDQRIVIDRFNEKPDEKKNEELNRTTKEQPPVDLTEAPRRHDNKIDHHRWLVPKIRVILIPEDSTEIENDQRWLVDEKDKRKHHDWWWTSPRIKSTEMVTHSPQDENNEHRYDHSPDQRPQMTGYPSETTITVTTSNANEDDDGMQHHGTWSTNTHVSDQHVRVTLTRFGQNTTQLARTTRKEMQKSTMKMPTIFSSKTTPSKIPESTLLMPQNYTNQTSVTARPVKQSTVQQGQTTSEQMCRSTVQIPESTFFIPLDTNQTDVPDSTPREIVEIFDVNEFPTTKENHEEGSSYAPLPMCNAQAKVQMEISNKGNWKTRSLVHESPSSTDKRDKRSPKLPMVLQNRKLAEIETTSNTVEAAGRVTTPLSPVLFSESRQEEVPFSNSFFKDSVVDVGIGARGQALRREGSRRQFQVVDNSTALVKVRKNLLRGCGEEPLDGPVALPNKVKLAAERDTTGVMTTIMMTTSLLDDGESNLAGPLPDEREFGRHSGRRKRKMGMNTFFKRGRHSMNSSFSSSLFPGNEERDVKRRDERERGKVRRGDITKPMLSSMSHSRKFVKPDYLSYVIENKSNGEDGEESCNSRNKANDGWRAKMELLKLKKHENMLKEYLDLNKYLTNSGSSVTENAIDNPINDTVVEQPCEASSNHGTTPKSKDTSETDCEISQPDGKILPPCRRCEEKINDNSLFQEAATEKHDEQDTYTSTAIGTAVEDMKEEEQRKKSDKGLFSEKTFALGLKRVKGHSGAPMEPDEPVNYSKARFIPILVEAKHEEKPGNNVSRRFSKIRLSQGEGTSERSFGHSSKGPSIGGSKNLYTAENRKISYNNYFKENHDTSSTEKSFVYHFTTREINEGSLQVRSIEESLGKSNTPHFQKDEEMAQKLNDFLVISLVENDRLTNKKITTLKSTDKNHQQFNEDIPKDRRTNFNQRGRRLLSLRDRRDPRNSPLRSTDSHDGKREVIDEGDLIQEEKGAVPNDNSSNADYLDGAYEKGKRDEMDDNWDKLVDRIINTNEPTSHKLKRKDSISTSLDDKVFPSRNKTSMQQLHFYNADEYIKLMAEKIAHLSNMHNVSDSQLRSDERTMPGSDFHPGERRLRERTMLEEEENNFNKDLKGLENDSRDQEEDLDIASDLEDDVAMEGDETGKSERRNRVLSRKLENYDINDRNGESVLYDAIEEHPEVDEKYQNYGRVRRKRYPLNSGISIEDDVRGGNTKSTLSLAQRRDEYVDDMRNGKRSMHFIRAKKLVDGDKYHKNNIQEISNALGTSRKSVGVEDFNRGPRVLLKNKKIAEVGETNMPEDHKVSKYGDSLWQTGIRGTDRNFRQRRAIYEKSRDGKVRKMKTKRSDADLNIPSDVSVIKKDTRRLRSVDFALEDDPQRDLERKVDFEYSELLPRKISYQNMKAAGDSNDAESEEIEDEEEAVRNSEENLPDVQLVKIIPVKILGATSERNAATSTIRPKNWSHFGRQKDIEPITSEISKNEDDGRESIKPAELQKETRNENGSKDGVSKLKDIWRNLFNKNVSKTNHSTSDNSSKASNFFNSDNISDKYNKKIVHTAEGNYQNKNAGVSSSDDQEEKFTGLKSNLSNSRHNECLNENGNLLVACNGTKPLLGVPKINSTFSKTSAKFGEHENTDEKCNDNDRKISNDDLAVKEKLDDNNLAMCQGYDVTMVTTFDEKVEETTPQDSQTSTSCSETTRNPKDNRETIQLLNMLAIVNFIKKLDLIMNREDKEASKCPNEVQGRDETIVQVERILILPENESKSSSPAESSNLTTIERVIVIDEDTKHNGEASKSNISSTSPSAISLEPIVCENNEKKDKSFLFYRQGEKLNSEMDKVNGNVPEDPEEWSEELMKSKIDTTKIDPPAPLIIDENRYADRVQSSENVESDIAEKEIGELGLRYSKSASRNIDGTKIFRKNHEMELANAGQDDINEKREVNDHIYVGNEVLPKNEAPSLVEQDVHIQRNKAGHAKKRKKKKRRRKKKKKKKRKKKIKGQEESNVVTKSGRKWWPFKRQLLNVPEEQETLTFDANIGNDLEFPRDDMSHGGSMAALEGRRAWRKNSKGWQKKSTGMKKRKRRTSQKSGRRKRQIEAGGSQVRGGQDCMDRRHPPNVDPAKYHESAHCLRFSDVWYSVYELENPILEHTVYLQLFEKHSLPDGTTHWDDLTQGSMTRLGTFVGRQRDSQPTIVFTYNGAKTARQKSAPNLNTASQRLLVPSPLTPKKGSKYSGVKGGSGEYLVVQAKDIGKDGTECDKAGVGFAAFSTQADRCGRAKGTCLKNQPLAYWRHDMEAREAGRPGCYFLSNFASVPNNPIKYNVSGSGSREFLGLEHHSSHVSTIDIEVRADYNAIVRVGSSARVTEVYVDSTAVERTVVTVVISNTGLTSSPYQTRIADCPTGLPVSWTKAQSTMQVIAPQHDRRVTLDLYGQLFANGFHCSVEVVNQRGELVAIRRIRVQKMDRCLCLWHCLCACIGSVSGLGCQPMSPEHYHAAGFKGPVPGTSMEPSMFANTVSDVLAFSALLVLLLLCLGMLKWLAGMFAPAIGRFGLDSLLEGSRLDKYFETDLKCRCVVTDSQGSVVHPETGQRTVRICNRKMEFFLNLIFFLIYPIVICFHYVKRKLNHDQGSCCSDESRMCLINEKDECPKLICVSTYGDSKNSQMEVEDTNYVINELKKSQESLQDLKRFKKSSRNRSSSRKSSRGSETAGKFVSDLLRRWVDFRNLTAPVGGLRVPRGTPYSLRGYFMNSVNGGYLVITPPAPSSSRWRAPTMTIGCGWWGRADWKCIPPRESSSSPATAHRRVCVQVAPQRKQTEPLPQSMNSSGSTVARGGC